jgi:hypothetical protein
MELQVFLVLSLPIGTLPTKAIFKQHGTHWVAHTDEHFEMFYGWMHYRLSYQPAPQEASTTRPET